MKTNYFITLCSSLCIGLTLSQALSGSQSSFRTVSGNDTNDQVVSFLEVVKSLIEDIRDEKDEAKRVRMCNTTIQLIKTHEQTHAEVHVFQESLDSFYKEWVTSSKALSKRTEQTEGLILQQKFVQQSSYLGLSGGKNIYFRDILHHLEQEFLKKSWGRPILVGIDGGVWYRKSPNVESLLTEESIMSSWMIFLEEMRRELQRIEKLIRAQLNDTAQIITRAEVTESRELFAHVQSFIKLCIFLHQQVADRKIKEAYRKQYAAIMKTPQDSDIIDAHRAVIAEELRTQESLLFPS